MKMTLKTLAATAAFAGALLIPAGQVLAACTNLADTTSADCKAAAACQKTIHAAGYAYINSIQKAHADAINKSQAGKLGKVPPGACQGGPNSGKPCLDNNGVCKVNPKGKPCSADADCGGAANSCDKTKGCNPSGGADTFECTVDTAKADFSKAAAAASKKLESTLASKCTQLNLDDLGVAAVCPGAATGTSNLADCIRALVGGDKATGKVVDTTTALFRATTGTGGAPPKAKPGPADLNPRMLVQFTGSQMLQIGTTASGSPFSSGGGVTPISLASCVGGNGKVSCINNADCGTDSMGAPGVCTPNANTGAPCTGTCRGLTGPTTVHVSNPPTGNILTVSGACSGGTATCLVTRTQDSGNGTGADGGIDFSTGEFFSVAPIKTQVYITGLGVDCNTFQPCPSCDPTLKTCDGGVNMGSACTAAPGPTQQCLPSGAPAANVPNPFTLSTEPKSMAANASPGKFCGHCTTDISKGCTFSYPGGANQECVDNGGGSPCVFDGSNGFQGDPNVTTLTADGERNIYAPLVTGLFCTGKTGVPLVDGSAGLPGPVRVVAPYTHTYVFSKD